MKPSTLAVGSLIVVPLAVLARLGPVAPSAATWQAQERPPGSSYEGQAFTFTRIADDVYIAVGTGNLTVMSNAAIVINENDVLVVDSHVSPAGAYALQQELRAITPKPIRYVVNSHYHFDHAHGNQIYGPSVEIIGHEFTRKALAEGTSMRGRTVARFIQPIPTQIANLRAQLDTATDEAARASLQRRLSIQENFKAATDAVRPTPPTVVLNDRLTLYRGGREIRLLFLGRGHTGGDVVVHLPAERIVMTGDLMLGGIPYMGDAYIQDWIETLEKLQQLEFDVILPGHGQPVRDRARVDHLQAYFRDLWGQIVELHRQGVPAAQAAQRIDLRAHAVNYPNIQAVGADRDAVERAYEVLNGAP
jgi:glyoxylase-like metal-dependent hydrolase (beta-lactamase superfamily II)